MLAIATLVKDDPYLKLPAVARIAARRARKARMLKVVITPNIPLPTDYRGMWFYNLIFETEARLPSILARRPTTSGQPRVEDIQLEVSRYFKISRSDMVSARRTLVIVRPRQIAYYLSKMLTRKSLPDIGRRFGDRDHTSILHGINKIALLRKQFPQLEYDLQSIASALGASGV